MAKKTKEKEEYIELKGLFGTADDYHVYHMTKVDQLVACVMGFFVGAAVIFAFFRNPVFMLLREQFKDLLESLTASYSAGRNTPDAFKDATDDMISIYGDDADIVLELQSICAGLGNNINIEQLLLDFAKRSGLDDVMSFANVFEVCNRQGSDLKRIVSDTRDIINDKIEIEMEIETMLSGNKNELNVMMAMPVVVVLSLSTMGTGTVVSNAPVNLIIKLICLGIFGAAYMIGRKIVNIKI